MKFLDNLFSMLGYTRTAQTKPSDNPYSNKIPIQTEDRDRILNPMDRGQGLSDQNLSAYPEQISGDPRMPNPQMDMDQHAKEDKVSLRPFDLMEDMPNNNTSDTQTNDINEKQIRTRPMNVDEINELDNKIASKMRKIGILTVDREMFMKRYEEFKKEATKIAATRKVPISEVIDELL